MSTPVGASPPPVPPEALEEQREIVRRQLELERGKSRILYEQAYQAYLHGLSGRPQPSAGQQAPTPVPEQDFMKKIQNAYADAYALRAFRDVMKEVTEETGQPPQTMPSADNVTTSLMKSGLPPQAVSQWLKGMDPEALGALIAFSSNNPMLAMMSYAMSQRQGQQQLTIKDVIELNAALAKRETQPNINIDIPKLVEAVKAQPPAADPDKIVNATLGAIRTGMELAGAGRSEEPKQKGLLESLFASGPEGVKIAKEIGLIGGDASILQIVSQMRQNDQQFQERMRASDRTWDLRLQQLQADTAFKKAQLAESRRRTELIAGTLRRVGSSIARGISEGIAEGEGKKAEGKTAEGEETPQEYKCECGAVITVPPGTQPGAIVTCAKCGAQYEATAPSGAKE